MPSVWVDGPSRIRTRNIHWSPETLGDMAPSRQPSSLLPPKGSNSSAILPPPTQIPNSISFIPNDGGVGADGLLQVRPPGPLVTRLPLRSGGLLCQTKPHRRRLLPTSLFPLRTLPAETSTQARGSCSGGGGGGRGAAGRRQEEEEGEGDAAQAHAGPAPLRRRPGIRPPLLPQGVQTSRPARPRGIYSPTIISSKPRGRRFILSSLKFLCH